MWSWYAPVGQTNDDQVSGLADHVAVGNTPRALLAVGDRLSAAADDNPMALLVRGFVIPEGRSECVLGPGLEKRSADRQPLLFDDEVERQLEEGLAVDL